MLTLKLPSGKVIGVDFRHEYVVHHAYYATIDGVVHEFNTPLVPGQKAEELLKMASYVRVVPGGATPTTWSDPAAPDELYGHTKKHPNDPVCYWQARRACLTDLFRRHPEFFSAEDKLALIQCFCSHAFGKIPDPANPGKTVRNVKYRAADLRVKAPKPPETAASP